MYIANKTKKYPCTGYWPAAQAVRFVGVEGVTLPIKGEIRLYSDDGFDLEAAHNTADYARQTLEGGILTLTNEPEPEPIPEPEPQEELLTLTDIAEAVIDLQVEVVNLKMGVN